MVFMFIHKHVMWRFSTIIRLYSLKTLKIGVLFEVSMCLYLKFQCLCRGVVIGIYDYNL